ncbi:cytochrome P450 CYP736A12-like [Tripterygium wilfordii]|uniref:cytochrome P450 CYP736A12-like n=1 Tax=Tripterygium wilfordii TaxID=458696 RepID=UPI0018F84B97|nr:cytochrome P450 CYP736A12-like [Tripterygium wilfordii]
MQKMSSAIFAILLLVLGFLWFSIFSQSKQGRKLPPGPRPLPVIGNLHVLGTLPHRNLAKLAKKYGSIMSIRLGSVPTIIVSSSDAAELFLKTYDTVFASRPKTQASIFMSYNNTGVAFAEYGPYWRNIRKLCTEELLSVLKVESMAPLRVKELGFLVELIKESVVAGEAVDLSEKIGELIENSAYKMVFGKNNDDKFDIRSLVSEASHLAGTFNVSDYVPFLEPFDLQGLKRRMKAYSKTMDDFIEKMLEEHEKNAKLNQAQDHRDFIDVLLSVMDQPTGSSSSDENPATYTVDRTNIKAIILDMILGGYETTATSILWTFSELFRHPEVLKKLQKELENVVGTNRMVEETDLSKLDYLNMVIKETFRLHPVAPFLIPRESIADITINGYHIPKKSRILVNSWAIGRDPNSWTSNVDEFLPERFMDSNIELGGQDLRLIPFGSGRRGCPGMNLGLTINRLIVAQLVHCFDWKLPNGMLSSELDMSETFGLSLPRTNHLLAVPSSYRLLA